jgi:hypothetical protein
MRHLAYHSNEHKVKEGECGCAGAKSIFTAETLRRGEKQTSKSNPESAEGAEDAEA